MKNSKLFLLFFMLFVGGMFAKTTPTESTLQTAIFNKGVDSGFWGSGDVVVGFSNENYESGTIMVSTPTGNITKTWADENFCSLCACCIEDILIIDAKSYAANYLLKGYHDRM